MPSSVIRTFAYEPRTERLDVTFTNGKRYAYLGVPAEEVRRFEAAPSKGRYFNNQIRDHYPFEKMR
jgi:hypothetical protein